MTYSVTALKLLFSTVDYFRVIAGKLRIIENFLCVELPVNINRKHQNFARLTFSTLRTHVGGRKMKVTNFIFEWHPTPGPLQFVLSKEGAECFQSSMIADLADIHTNNKIGMPSYSKQSYG